MRISRNLPVLTPQPAPPLAEVLALRTNWKWAYLSHFLFTYNPVLHLEDIQLSELEDDLAAGTFHVIPAVMQRLLMSLTPHDKRMILENWQQQLRKQSLKRAPDHNLMGTEDDPVDFTSLIMSDKLNLFQSLCEWQFHNPNNLRARMRDDDEYANWRMEPIAHDAKGNAYWLMGGNRLWVQYAPPRKPTPKSRKRKQPAVATANGRKSAKRGQTAVVHSSKTTVTTVSTKSKPQVAASNSASSRPVRETRSRAAGTSNSQKSRAVGTRVSTRLRGREEEDIWQPIPEEWLKESKDDIAGLQDVEQNLTGKGKGREESKREATMQVLDDGSELTSLSDLSEIPEADQEVKEDEEVDEDEESALTPSLDFSSSSEEVWETVCVTLAEWEAFPQRFEKSTHRGEKTFYKLLTNDLVPMITEVLRVDVRKKVMEEAVVHRKRSSRIAVKESAREAERAEARRKAEQEKEMERHKRWEARAQKEEEERTKRESMRSARLRERGRTGSESVDVDVVSSAPESKPVLLNGTPFGSTAPVATPIKFLVNASKSGTQTPKEDESWELDCEICHKRGMNLDDGQGLMCCERCNKWQHIRCHDQADFIAGRPRRNWELDEFLCAVCATKGAGALRSLTPQQQQPPQQPHNYQANAQAWARYNGVMATANGAVAMSPHQSSPPDHRAAAPAKSTFKQQTAHDASSYPNGRTAYSVPQAHYTQPSYSTPIVPQMQHFQRQQYAANVPGNAGHPTPNSSQSRTPAPYTSSPNMYLSNYSGNYRPPQNLGGQPQQPSSTSHYRPSLPATQAGSWSQQQTQYGQPANHQTWNGGAYGSGSQPYATSGTSALQPSQRNGYYRSHPATSSIPLAPPNNIPSTQAYYQGGSNSGS